MTATWMTPEEAADYIKVTLRQLTEWRAKGTGPLFAAPGHKTIRYNCADLDRFMHQCRVVPPVQAFMEDRHAHS